MSRIEPEASSASTSIVRRPRPEEIDAVWELANAIPTAAHWSRRDYDGYCRAADAQAKALFVACVSGPGTDANPLPIRATIAGFAAFSALSGPGGGECTLENMAVDEAWRRRGLARRLLAAGMLWCRSWCGAGNREVSEPGLVLEVRASNRGAVAFYEHCDFLVTGIRPGYYSRPDEDAVLMSKPFHSSSSSR